MDITVPPLAPILADLPDCRHAHGLRHTLPAILPVACAAVLCGCSSQAALAAWLADCAPALRTRLGLTHPTGPAQATLSRVFAALDIGALEAALTHWARAVLATLTPLAPRAATPPPRAGRALAGKTLRGSAHAGVPGQNLLSAVAHEWGSVLAQQAVAGKTNEITVAPTLLAGFIVTERVITAAALLTQREIAATIVAGGGDYLLAVKENQPTFAADVRDVFTARTLLADTIKEAYEARLVGGRIEERALQASTALVGYSTWPGRAQVLERPRVVTDKRTGRIRSAVAYVITSRNPERATAQQLLQLWRRH
ncbi:MAG: ISAs1 family transposase [Chloroflexota bacterium]|nr:ISAs1 family transposase [Chloroflexota bacterium]